MATRSINFVEIPSDVAERFWGYFEYLENGCWKWTRAQCSTRVRYGTFALPRPRAQRMVMTRRLAWILTYGAIPDGMEVLHRCDFGLCGNPEHLFLGTQQDNVDDMCAKGSHQSGHKCGVRGPIHTQRRLTEDDVRKIRSMFVAGHTKASIAREFGIGDSTISGIILGSSWTHVL